MAVNLPTIQDLLRKAIDVYKNEYLESPEVAAFGPGRVNLIGEHVDYNDGFVLPMALPMVTLIVGKKNKTNEVKICTTSKDVDEPHKVKFSLDKDLPRGNSSKWANYVIGVIMHFGRNKIPGFNAIIVSSVPVGSGLSSSAAIEMATFTFLEVLTGNPLPDLVQKALACQIAEHEYAGVPCGIMDQLVSALGRESMALLIDCRSLDVTYVPFNSDDVVVLITNSNVKHELCSGEYALRRKQCLEVAKLLNKKSFRDLKEEDLENLKIRGVDGTLISRGRHVFTEINRTKEAAKALMEKDFVKLGRLMTESHNSLRYDFEVSCKELDEIVESTLNVDGVYGSRMTGGGFGGCTVTLLRKNAVDECMAAIKKKYSGRPDFYICKAFEEAKELKIPEDLK